jgi:hypothetical protein
MQMSELGLVVQTYDQAGVALSRSIAALSPQRAYVHQSRLIVRIKEGQIWLSKHFHQIRLEVFEHRERETELLRAPRKQNKEFVVSFQTQSYAG